MAGTRFALGIDVGGTKIAAAIVVQDGSAIGSGRRDTPPTGHELILAAMIEAADEAGSAAGVRVRDARGVGIAVPGSVDRTAGVAIGGVNVGWDRLDMGPRLGAHYGLDWAVENDTNAAVWGEAQFGAAKGRLNAVYITVGTGIGGGAIENGHLLLGHMGGAAEVGHVIVRPGGPVCACGTAGCAEAVAAGPAIAAAGVKAMAGDAASLLHQLSGGNPERVSAETVARAYAAGDSAAGEVWLRAMDEIALALVAVWRVLAPEIFAVGGGVARAGDSFFGPLRDAFAKHTGRALPGGREGARRLIVPAGLGDAAGSVGASALILRPVPGRIGQRSPA